MNNLTMIMEQIHTYFLNNTLDVIGFVLTMIGGFFALLQWHDSVKNSRAMYVKDLLRSVMDDIEIQKFQNLTDYEKEWYTETFHTSEINEIAKIADRTLFTYNYICYLYDTNVINKNELEIFTYYMLALAHNKDLMYYLLDLYQYSIHKEGDVHMFPFDHYLRFCEKNGCISKSVRDPNFFKYFLCLESNNNGNQTSTTVPINMETLVKKVTGHLFIKSVSRCRCCDKYSEGNCNANCNLEDHYWAGKDKSCEQFGFSSEKWLTKIVNSSEKVK